MDPVAIAALTLSIISILLWVFTFLSPRLAAGNLAGNSIKHRGEEPAPENKETGSSLAVPENKQTPVAAVGSQDRESQFMSDTQKFSNMVHKNLEILNTRVGVKFSVKPLSENYSVKRKGPNFVDSMDISEDEDERMLSDESDGEN